MLVLHRAPFDKIGYDRALDHALHDIVYLGTEESLRDIPRTLRCTQRILVKNQSPYSHVQLHRTDFDGTTHVVGTSEYNRRFAAQIRKLLGCPGMLPDDYDAVDNKVIMKKRIRDAHLRVPGFMTLAAFVAGEGPTWKGPTVLKPQVGSGSEGVVAFRSIDDLWEAVSSGVIAQGADIERLEIEEFVEGEIYHFDGFAHEGNVAFVQPSRYHGTPLAFSLGEPLGSMHVDDGELAREAATYVRAAGVQDAVFHLEMIASPRGLVFMEIAPRPGGCRVVECIREKWGVDLALVDVAIQAGESPPRGLERKTDDLFGSYIVPGHLHKGMRCRVQFPQELERYVIDRETVDHDYVFDGELSYFAGELPLSLLLRLRPDTIAADIFAQLDKDVTVEYSAEPLTK